MGYTIKKIGSIDELMQFGSDGQWNALLAKSQTNIVYLSFEWVVNWWRCFGEGSELFVLVVRDNEMGDKKPIAIAPLMITTSKLRIKTIEFIGASRAGYCDLIISGGCEDKGTVVRCIYDYLLKEKDKWDIVSLKEIPEQSPTLANSEEALKNSNALFNIAPDFSSWVCPTLIFDREKNINKKINKKSIRHNLRYIRELGTISHDHCSDADEARVLLDTFFRYHIARWKSTNTPSMFEDERYRRFYTGLVNSLLPKKWVDLSFLRLDGNPIALQFGLTYDNKYDLYTITYDADYARYSPGMILLRFNIEDYLSRGFREVDFLRGDEQYKFRFSNTIKSNYTINIHKMYPVLLIDKTAGKLVLEIRKHDGIRRILRGIKDRLTDIFRALR